MSVAVGVAAHHLRRRAAWAMALDVDAESFMVDAELSDPGSVHRRANANHDAVWSNLLAADRDWCVVLEDDALPVDGFRAFLPGVLASAPAPVVSLYTDGGHPGQIAVSLEAAHRDGREHGWWLTDRTWWGVGLAIRTELVADMLAYVAGDPGQPYDQRLRAWCKRRGHDVALTNPSLVDHADGPSLVWGEKRAGIERRAWSVGVPSAAALRSVYRMEPPRS